MTTKEIEWLEERLDAMNQDGRNLILSVWISKQRTNDMYETVQDIMKDVERYFQHSKETFCKEITDPEKLEIAALIPVVMLFNPNTEIEVPPLSQN